MIINAISTFVLLTGYDSEKSSNLSHYVNPFIGASTSTKLAGTYHGLGKTFPGATTPFGMVQVSPQTITEGDNGSSYSDEHKTIEGFTFTPMSKIGWYGDLGNFIAMSTTVKNQLIAGREDGSIKEYCSAYDKKSEKASADYYCTILTDYGINRSTSQLHTSVHLSDTYLIPEQINLACRIGGTSTTQYVKVENEHAIRGWMKCPPVRQLKGVVVTMNRVNMRMVHIQAGVVRG